LIAGICFCSFDALAKTDDKRIIQELLENSGADQQMKMLPDVIKAMVPVQMEIHKADEKITNTFNKRVSSEFFVAEDILNTVTRQLSENFNRSHAEAYLKWLDSKLGKKITKLEIEASSSQPAMWNKYLFS
jgi:hypothetical protein